MIGNVSGTARSPGGKRPGPNKRKRLEFAYSVEVEKWRAEGLSWRQVKKRLWREHSFSVSLGYLYDLMKSSD